MNLKDFSRAEIEVEVLKPLRHGERYRYGHVIGIKHRGNRGPLVQVAYNSFNFLKANVLPNSGGCYPRKGSNQEMDWMPLDNVKQITTHEP